MSMPGVQMPHWAPPVSRKAAGACSSLPCRRQPLDRRDRRALDLAHRHQARVDHRAVDQHRARAALALAAALLGAGQAQVLAQHVEQAAHARGVQLDRRAVDGEP